ncbi:AAA family ATPase [Pedobacter frigidisoli]|uniref:AAA family ATPase n=1 Tax=Pedobacter frigidisoli TaxID=2530455 RepID=UPI00292E4520|nr:AAA family ATPase [Pedobacter frigidisoli]
MSIPNKINAEHVQSSIEEINKNGIPRNRTFDRYFLLISEKKYPVKYVISLASKYTDNNSGALAPNVFNTYQAQKYLTNLGFNIIDKYDNTETTNEGFKLLNLRIVNNKLLGTINYSFINQEDTQNKIYSTVIIGPNGTGKSNLFRIIIELFRELHSQSLGGARFYNVDGRFDLEFSINNDIYSYTNLIDENIAAKFTIAGEVAQVFLLKNGEIIEFGDAQFPLAIVANSIMLTDKFPVLNNDAEKFPIYKYLGVRNTPQNASTRSYVRRTVDYIVSEKDSNAFRSGLSKVTEFLGINNSIEVYYLTINAPTFFKGETSLETFRKYFSDLEEKYKGKEYPPQKLNVYQRLVKEEGVIKSLSDFCNRLFSEGRLQKNRKGSSIKKIAYNLVEESSFQLLKKEAELLDHLRAIGLLYAPEISLNQSGEYNLQESSSGEYHFFSSMVALMATVKMNSLIFLDEPEVSLHPNWQMKYLSFLRSLFSDENYNTCHILVATHSHFLISDLEGDNSKIIGLKKVNNSKDGNNIQVVDLPRNVDTYGWSAEDVLYNVFDVLTVRNKYIADEIGGILDLLSKGQPNEVNRLPSNKYQLLLHLKDNLKDIDPLKQVVMSILKKVE